VILLVDASALIWAFADPGIMDPGTSASLQDPVNDVLVSAATVWEIEVKRRAGRLKAPDGLLADLHTAGFATIPMTPEDAVAAAALPMHHRDPFDRILVAQARRLGATIVSRDRAFDAYDVERMPA
jgi:PIN domain nuclease of toxin-antitoxin system